MGIVFRSNGPEKDREDAVRELAQSLGFRCSRPTRREGPILRGVVDGYKVKVRTSSMGQCRIEVDFESGVKGMRIHQRSADLLTNRVEVSTEDESFEAELRVLMPTGSQHAGVLNYLTAHRRQIIRELNEVFDYVKIKDDEVELRMPSDISVEDIRKAIEVSVLAVKGLDVAAIPQDSVQLGA